MITTPNLDIVDSKNEFDPPEHLNDDAKKMWNTVIDDHPTGWFKVSDLPLLEAYCEAYATTLEANKNIEIEGAVLTNHLDNRVSNPWVDIRRKEVATMSTLATKLRLAPNARYDRKKTEAGLKAGQNDKPKRKMYAAS